LYKDIDLLVKNSYFLTAAAIVGDLMLVSRLLLVPQLDPASYQNMAIRIAACNGHLSVVKRLLDDPRVDPSADNNMTIRIAACNGHLSVVKRLLDDPRVDATIALCEALKEMVISLYFRSFLLILVLTHLQMITVLFENLQGKDTSL
jgi:DNA-binding FrmR family transcriptional regulator